MSADGRPVTPRRAIPGLRLTVFLCGGLGFDKCADPTAEHQVKGKFADYGVRIARDLGADLRPGCRGNL